MNDIRDPHRASDSSNERPTSRTGAVRLYALSGIGCFLLAGVIWIVSQPEERTGPPVDQTPGQAADDPHGDPHGGNHAELHARIDELRNAVASGASSSEDRLLLANLLYDQGVRDRQQASFAEAADLYASYLVDHPENPDARTDYAFTLSQTGRLDQAIEELLEVQREHPTHQNSAFNLAVMYKEKDMPDSVLHYMARTAGIDSTSRTGRAALEVLRAYSGAH